MGGKKKTILTAADETGQTSVSVNDSNSTAAVDLHQLVSMFIARSKLDEMLGFDRPHDLGHLHTAKFIGRFRELTQTTGTPIYAE